MISEFQKLSQEYKALSTEENCPYDLSSKIDELVKIYPHIHDIIHESKPFISYKTPKLFEQFMTQTPIHIMNTVLDLYINNDVGF